VASGYDCAKEKCLGKKYNQRTRQILARFIWITVVQIKLILKMLGFSNRRHDKFPQKFAFITPINTSVKVKRKVKYILVQALGLCIGRTAHRGE
jgi:hypothetical protein